MRCGVFYLLSAIDYLLLLKLTDFSVGHCHKWLFNSDISHFVIPAEAGIHSTDMLMDSCSRRNNRTNRSV